MQSLESKLANLEAAERSIAAQLATIAAADRQAAEAFKEAREVVESNHSRYLILDTKLKSELERLRIEKLRLIAANGKSTARIPRPLLK